MTMFYQNPENEKEVLADYCPTGWNKISTAKGSAIIKANAIVDLKALLSPGDKVYTILRKCASSGMSRHISFFIINVENKPHDISWLMSRALDYRQGEKGGLIISGCGMDMGFHLVYNLSRVLFKDSTDKKDAGYSLNQEWL